MNKMTFFTIVLMNLCACRRDKECHQELEIINNSNVEIVFALKFYDGEFCKMDGRTITIGGSYKLDAPDKCWENSGIEYYILNGNEPVSAEFVPCDSLDIYFDILAHQTYSKEELASRNFEVTYP